MAALKLFTKQNDLHEEIHLSASVLGKKRDYIEQFLLRRGIFSLSEISVNVLSAYIHSVRCDFVFDQSKISSYKGDLETVYFDYQKHHKNPLTLRSIPRNANSAKLRKALVFLMALGIEDPNEISGEVRIQYEAYLMESVPTKVTEYLKALDQIKLSEIKKLIFTKDVSYENRLLFLGYYPNWDIAQRFYYTQRKEFLYFDFSLPVPVLLKKQIFTLLKEDLSHIGERKNHYMIQHFITPLYYLYDFCIKEGISDIKQVTKDQVIGFQEYLNSNMDAISKGATQVMYRARKFIFLHDTKADFSATAWFLDRFDLSDRANPTRIVDAFYFDDITDENRIYFQHYMKYLLVLSPKYSLQSLLEKYHNAKEFIHFLEDRNTPLSDLSYKDMEDFISLKDSMECDPATFNGALTKLSFFLTCLSTREKLFIPSFPFEYFYKKAFYLHHDRSVPESIIDRIFMVLPDFPETLGLMFLTLYSTGLRINEVCSLKRDALFIQNETCWIHIYQYKLKSDKEIPIPEELYRLLKKHISNATEESEFIFSSIKYKDRPYQAATFIKQMQRELLLYEETRDITFRSHDFRHTIATDLYFSGAKLQTTRAFLGHTRDDMTKQYIDHLPGHIDALQAEYFKEHTT